MARRIVSRAHLLRREGWLTRAVDLLDRAAWQCRCPRIKANFDVLRVLFGEGSGGYREITRREAIVIAQAAGCDGERLA